jgi:pimeloyl-ACP methyl ester carboxylesterase
MKLSRVALGAGDPIVFVHGFLGSHDVWADQLRYFARRNTAIGCDLRGHGATALGAAPLTIEGMGADVAGLLAELDLRRALLVGHSLGCRVVLEAARQAAGRVTGLVLVDGSCVALDRDVALERFEHAIAADGYSRFVTNHFENMFGADPPAWKSEVIRSVQSSPEHIGRPLFRDVIIWDSERAICVMREIRVPVLTIQSTAFGPDHLRLGLEPGRLAPYQEFVSACIPAAIHRTVPDAGHFCMRERPDMVNRLIEDFDGCVRPPHAMKQG